MMSSTEAPSGNGVADETSKHASPKLDSVMQDNSTTNGSVEHDDGPAAKRIRLDRNNHDGSSEGAPERRKGIAPIKAEYLIYGPAAVTSVIPDDDAAEAKPQSTHVDGRDGGAVAATIAPGRKLSKAEKKARQGQNKARKFGKFGEYGALCRSRANVNEFSSEGCKFGDKCREGHDIREYMEHRENLNDGECPIWKERGQCPAGWKCKWIKSHMIEADIQDDQGNARKELQLIVDEERHQAYLASDEGKAGVKNEVSTDKKRLLMSKKFLYKKSEPFLRYLEQTSGENPPQGKDEKTDENGDIALDDVEARRNNNASYRETPYKPSEKRRLHISASTPLLAPLTTTGNLPFRRLCTSLGASITYSEMAMSIPLIQGQKGEWALVRAHTSEKNFGVQISAKKPWEALKAAEVLAGYTPNLNLIDMNSGCSIDLVYRAGGGAGLLENSSRLSKMMRGMNYVSGEIPITVKLRTGCSDKHPVAKKIIRRLVDEGDVAAITLHGRSRQQRYSREADWGYIAECSSLIERLKLEKETEMDTSADDKEKSEARRSVPYFIGNGDCYSYEDYYASVEKCNVDSVLIARGALIKPWIFEEIHAKQYLDKPATERLSYVEQFAKFGLEYWGSDEMGVNNTRRFLCEFLSFTYRYVPVGLLEVLPPRLQDRPPRFRGRNELETLLASDNYKDWIKISEMFLGKASEEFKFIPKHKSNSYDSVEAEG